MTFKLQTFARHIAAVVVLAAFAAPTALAVDRRAPDTRDAASVAHRSVAPVDLRSPDTRDVANGRSPALNSGRVQVTVVRPGGFHWSDAGIGAGAGAGFVLVLLGTSLLIRSGRNETQVASLADNIGAGP